MKSFLCHGNTLLLNIQTHWISQVLRLSLFTHSHSLLTFFISSSFVWGQTELKKRKNSKTNAPTSTTNTTPNMCVLSKLYSPSDNKTKTNPKSIPKSIPNTNQQNQGNTSDCVICYTEIQKNTNTSFTTQCDHTFCQDCITSWLLTNHNCPLCRTNLVNTNHVPRTITNDEDNDEDIDLPFGVTMITSSVIDIPDNVMRLALLRAYNLTICLNYEDDEDDEEIIAPNLITNWNIQTPPTTNGWRIGVEVYTTTLIHKDIKYAIYVKTIAHNQPTDYLFLASSNICHIYTHIVPISFKSRTTIPQLLYSKQNIIQNLKQKRKQTKYRSHKNTAQSKQRYTHH